MALDISGTPRSLQIEGIPFRLAADVNVSKIITQFENSMIATSGSAMRKMMKRIPAMEGVTLIVNGDEEQQLIAFAEQTADVKLALTDAAGNTYRSEGTIEIENVETEEQRMTVQLLPRGRWAPFLGS